MSELVGSIHYDVELNTGKLIDDSRKVDRELSNVAGKFNIVAAAVAALAAAMTAAKIAQRADEFRLLATRVEVAAGSVEAGAAAFNELISVSRRTQSSLAGNIEVFNRLNQSILQMGGTQQDTLNITELLAKAIKVSGASSVEAKAAMLQFGQALGSGKLAGDELRSLLETAPYLMRQLADGIGVPVGALKQLGEEGKLTADVVTNALTSAADRIDADFRKFPQTIEAAMVMASDAAGLALLKFDELAGGSAALTGVATGLGEALDGVTQQLSAIGRESGALGRNEAVRSWADGTRLALSYLIDAADVVWQTLSVLGRNVAFVFRGIGSEIGGIGAQVAAVMRGDFAQARTIGEEMRADAARRRAELDAADARTLGRGRLAGQAMRDNWATNAAMRGVEDRGFVPRTGSTLRAPSGAGATGAGAAGRKKADGRDYLAEMEEGFQRRLEQWTERNAEALDRAEEAARAKLLSDVQAGRDLATQTIVGGLDPVARIQYEADLKSRALLEAAMRDQENAQLYADARVSLEQETADRIAQIEAQRRASQDAANSALFTSYSNLFGGIADVTKSFAGEQSAAFRVLFAASKAFAIAESIIKIQQGIANAAALPFPANLAAMGSVVAATGSIISTIQGVQYGGGRQYGGPVSAGSMYRVNETGRPEMFTAANGSQYMLPTASGKVTAADKLGGGPTVLQLQVINQHPTAQVTTQQGSDGNPQLVISEVASQIADHRGPIWSALQSNTNVRSAL